MQRLPFFLVLIFLGCTSNNKDKNLEIIIEDAQSYKYDLKGEVYTIFYTDKGFSEIKFDLSKEEENKIAEEYYDLRINKIAGDDKRFENIYIEDDCMTMPKLFTKIHVKTKNKLQEIKIDESCNNFKLSNYNEAERIKKFIRFVKQIVKSKPQIKNAPESNIMYM